MADLSQLKLPNNQTYNIKDSTAVKAITWDTTNKKLTKTINGTTTDVVTGATILNGITSNQITTGLGYTPPHQPMGTASGNIATFEAADLPLSKLRVAITAQQDLRGYDYPWVGGSGKNKLRINSFNSTTLNGVTFTYDNGVINANGTATNDIIFVLPLIGVTTNYTTIDNIVDGIIADTNYILTGCTNGTPQTYWIQILISGSGSEPANYNNPATFSFTAEQIASQQRQIAIRVKNGTQMNNVKFYPMIRLASVTDATFAPYSNICPISGWSAVDVTRCGKNWFDVSTYVSGNSNFTKSGETFSNSITDTKTSFELNVFSVDNNDNLTSIVSDVISSTGQKVYSFSISSESKIYIKHNGATQDLWLRFSQKLPTGSYKLIFNVDAYNPSTTNGLTISNIMVVASTETNYTFEPYNGNTYSLIFTDGSNPLTVYYGTVDLISGLLTINKCGDDMGNMNYTYQSLSGGRNGFSVSVSDMKETTGGSEIIDAISSCYKATNYNGTWANGNMSYFYPTGKTVIFINNNYTDASTFKTAMTGQQFVYPLATPLTYQLSKQQIRSLVGVNNIFASTGEVSVTYVTQEYDGLTANYASEAGGITQTPTTSSDTNEYPLLLKYSNNGSEEANIVKTTRDARFTYKPNANALTASYYNGNTLVRETIYGSAGIRTQGRDSYNRNVNSEYLQEGFNVKYSASLSGGDLTDAGVTCQIDDCGGVDEYQPQIDIYNTRYASASQDSGVSKEGVIDHESIKVYEDHFNDNYASLSSQYKGFQAYKDNIYLIHQEWSQGSATPTINEVMQIGIDNIALTGNTWDGAHTSLKDAITAIYLSTLCYSASISRGSGWTQKSTSTAFPSSTTGTYLFMIKDSNGTIYSRIPVPAADFAGTTSTRPLIVRSNGTSSDANNIMAYWSSKTKFYTYAGSSSMPTGTFTLVIHYTPLNI